MRTLLAISLVLTGFLALSATADARKARGYYPPRYYQPYYGQPRYYGQPGYGYAPPRNWSRERQVCEERAQAEDPTGLYAGFPCWAREAFGRGGSGRR